MAINSVSPGSDALVKTLHGKVDFQHENTLPVVSGILNHVLNANFETCKRIMDPILDKYVGDVIKSVSIPLFDELPIQDFFV